MTTFDPRYRKGIDHFNKREFYDAHETWEDLWHEEHGEAHDFLQGLIQVATALHHFEASNLKGARLLYLGARELLERYGDVFWGLRVKEFMADLQRCMGALEPYRQEDLPGRYHPEKRTFPVQLDPTLIPTIRLEA